MLDKKNNLTYISLFSSAGVGCYGFKLEGFACIATNEIIEKRLNIQRHNDKCKYESGYISGDIKDERTKKCIFDELERWKEKHKIKDLDVLISTPPCQGMSIANHKKKDEKNRNSLVVESIKLTNDIKPKFFLFENVRNFLTTVCTDTDGIDKPIKEAIELNLGGYYNILFKVINFKEYGSNSSRTRTLVIGTRKDLEDITPYDVFIEKQDEKILKKVIGDLPSLKSMGEISKDDIYHNFRSYSEHMMDWIKDLKEGQSAFDNPDPEKRPYQIINGVKVHNQNKNGDKYSRCFWNKVAPCIHTRNDIMASQSTVHPTDNRVFSIRELMRMMTIPTNFKWSAQDINFLNSLSAEQKQKYLAKEEINIRQSIGEAVPTIIFQQIAKNISNILCDKKLNYQNAKKIVDKNNLKKTENLKTFIELHFNEYSLTDFYKIVEISNAERLRLSAYYTRQDICYSIIKELPDVKDNDNLQILEPSVGVGNFLPLLIKKYSNANSVTIDVVDIDNNALIFCKLLLKKIEIPKNIKINFINDDFLLFDANHKYDIVIGNPPFGKVNDKQLLIKYKKNKVNQKTSNIFSYFIERAIEMGKTVALICPKSLLSAPEFNLTRNWLSGYKFSNIIDYGEKGFTGVKIETISFIVSLKNGSSELVKIESNITKNIAYLSQDYVFDNKYPVWLIYRNNFFDQVTKKLKFNIFSVFRDRNLTKKHTKASGQIKVLKSRNIGDNEIISLKNYDSYIDNAEEFAVGKFLNKPNCILVPNLSYNPRACFLPKNSIADGSVAILQSNEKILKKDLSYYKTEEFRKFYMLSRNLGTRSLNIDSNSVYFFGIKK